MDHIVCRVYDPVFPDTCCAVFEQLCKVVHPLTGRRDNLYYPVRSSIAAFISEFAFITYDAYIRCGMTPASIGGE